ncbi:MAG: hypothetical protein SVM79_02865 [Chloroflexota bacterium]|nr:hypothetical protein [Chloroflexota bacterium]
MKRVVIVGLLLALVSVMAGACGEEKAREVPPEVDDSISDAELQDLQSIARQKGISLQAAIDRFGGCEDSRSSSRSFRRSRDRRR